MKYVSASAQDAMLNQSNGSVMGGNPSSPLPAVSSKFQRTSFITGIKAYYASLLTVGVVMPVIASFIAVGIYLFTNPPVTGCDNSVTPACNSSLDLALHALLFSSLFTAILWLLIAIPASNVCTARGANPRNYSFLLSRLHQLQAMLGLSDDSEGNAEDIRCAMKAKGYDEKKDRHTWDVVEEACACCVDIERKFSAYPSGRTWSMGTEYNIVWALLHHAEEALIEAADFDSLLRTAKHDFMAIQGSRIDGKDELLADILRAVVALKLSPREGEEYLKVQQPDKLRVTLSQLTDLIHRPCSQYSGDEASGEKNEVTSSNCLAAARCTLREVRSTLNAYRDKRWEGLVSQRGRLLKAIAVTGIVTYAFVCFVLANGPQPSLILASTLFYMVGAVAGLFVRFYRESKGNASTDDFGLSTIRLLSIPLLSGLAGIAGAIAVILLPDLTSQASAFALPSSIKSLLTPQFLLAAAAFGASPNLVIKGLQDKADKYETELQSSKASESKT